MPRTLGSLWFLLLCVMLSGAALSAQDEPPATSTDTLESAPVVISASRWNERTSTVSREIITITPAQIARQNPPTTADAIAQTGLVHVQKSQLGGGSPMLRGYGANTVLLVVDGVRMNNAIYRAGNLQNSITIDGAALDAAEILFGPGSVQYGSDALGGAMVFTTRRPTFAADAELPHLGGTAVVRYGSAANLAAGSVAIDAGSDVLASSTVISVSRFGDLTGGANFMSAYPTFGRRDWYVERINGVDTELANINPTTQVPSGYAQINLLENLHWRLSKGATLEYGGQFTTSTDVPRYDRLVERRNNQPRFAEWYYGPQLWTMHSLTYRTGNGSWLADEAAITASMQYYEESRNDRPFQNDLLRSQNETVWVGSLNADLRRSLSEDPSAEIDVYYGIEAYLNDVQSAGQRRNIVTNVITPAASRYPNGGSTVSSAAAYAQLRYGFSDRLTVSAGVRGTWYDLRSSIADTSVFSYPFTDLSLTTSAFTGSIGATWVATSELTVHANAASGFRAPNVDDIGKVFETGPGVLVIPNSSLGPEYVRTLEAGLLWQPSRRLSFEVNGYTSWATDAIEVRPSTLNGLDTIDLDGAPTAIYANTNIGQARISGATARLQTWLVSNLQALATVSYTYGIDTEANAPVSHIPPAFGTVQLTWREPTWSVGAQFWWAAAQTFDQIPMDDEAKIGINYTPDGTPAWRRLDLSASLRPLSSLEMVVQLENIFDLNYHTFASGISAPGRNLVMSARLLF